MMLRLKRKKKEQKPKKQNLQVFIYNLVMNSLKAPSERYLYETMLNAPKRAIHCLLGAFKLPYVSYLLKKIWDRRYVCICPDMDTARALYVETLTGGACYNGENSENVERFNNGDVDHLFIGDADIPDLKDVEAVVFLQSTCNDEAVIQKLSKAMSDAEQPKLYFFTFHDSIDEEYRDNARTITDNLTEVEFPYKSVKL